MGDYQITCINKPDRLNQHEHITHIGNSAGHWRITREGAIDRIDRGADTFYTIDQQTGRRVDVAVVREAGRQPFLRTHADGRWNDNLLAQDECGADCRII
jgi:Protein of unknown function (DUF3892)